MAEFELTKGKQKGKRNESRERVKADTQKQVERRPTKYNGEANIKRRDRRIAVE